MDRRSARLMELGELEDPTKRIITKDFSPAALKTDLLRALNLEEMAHRTLQRRVAALIFARMHTPVSRTSFFYPIPPLPLLWRHSVFFLPSRSHC